MSSVLQTGGGEQRAGGQLHSGRTHGHSTAGGQRSNCCPPPAPTRPRVPAAPCAPGWPRPRADSYPTEGCSHRGNPSTKAADGHLMNWICSICETSFCVMVLNSICEHIYCTEKKKGSSDIVAKRLVVQNDHRNMAVFMWFLCSYFLFFSILKRPHMFLVESNV